MLLALSALSMAYAADTDLDSVPDNRDRCSYEDDTVDLDGNGWADCRETLLGEFGFSTATSTGAHYYDAYGVIPTWTTADANGYVYSGAATVGLYEVLSLYYAACIPVAPGLRYTVMGQFGSDTTDSFHDLVVIEFADANCSVKSTSSVVASGYRPSGTPSIDLVGTWRPSGLAIRSAMVYATFDNVGVLGSGWFDNLSMHR